MAASSSSSRTPAIYVESGEGERTERRSAASRRGAFAGEQRSYSAAVDLDDDQIGDGVIATPARPSRLTSLSVPALTESGADTGRPSSPSPRITVAKKQFSLNREDSLWVDMMAHPTGEHRNSEEKIEQPPKKTPSSKGTVLTMAGLFIVGLTLVLSGVLVLLTQTALQFRIAAGVFLGLGSLFLVICIVLQRKNVVKYVTEMEQDYFFFLNITGNPIWKLMFQDIDVGPQSKRPRVE